LKNVTFRTVSVRALVEGNRDAVLDGRGEVLRIL